MHFSPRMSTAIRQKAFDFDDATKIQWAMDLYETAPVGTEIEYSPEMTRLLERFFRWADTPEVKPMRQFA